MAQARLGKAQQFPQVAGDALALAGDGQSVADSAVTLYVHAGIAASNAICARTLGKYAQGSDHQQAVPLLAKVDTDAANKLAVLLGMKTRAGYGHDPIRAQGLRRAQRAAKALVERAAR